LFEFEDRLPNVRLKVIHLDDQVIVADKPAGLLLSVPGKQAHSSRVGTYLSVHGSQDWTWSQG